VHGRVALAGGTGREQPRPALQQLTGLGGKRGGGGRRGERAAAGDRAIGHMGRRVGDGAALGRNTAALPSVPTSMSSPACASRRNSLDRAASSSPFGCFFGYRCACIALTAASRAPRREMPAARKAARMSESRQTSLSSTTPAGGAREGVLRARACNAVAMAARADPSAP
jgi:hypothetical protein